MMEEIIPIGMDEWEKVVELYLVEFLVCNVDSLRQKYKLIHEKKVLTGNLNMPEEVCLAKKVKYMIRNRVQLRGGVGV